MLQLCEDKGGADNLGELAGAGGGVLEGSPALGEQGEPAFSLESEAAQERVPGLAAGGETLASAGVLHRDVNADPGTLVAAVGQGGHAEGGSAVCRYRFHEPSITASEVVLLTSPFPEASQSGTRRIRYVTSRAYCIPRALICRESRFMPVRAVQGASRRAWSFL